MMASSRLQHRSPAAAAAGRIKLAPARPSAPAARASAPAARPSAAAAPARRRPGVAAAATGYATPSSAGAATLLQQVAAVTKIVPDLRDGSLLGSLQAERPAAATVSYSVLRGLLAADALGLRPYEARRGAAAELFFWGAAARGRASASSPAPRTPSRSLSPAAPLPSPPLPAAAT